MFLNYVFFFRFYWWKKSTTEQKLFIIYCRPLIAREREARAKAELSNDKHFSFDLSVLLKIDDFGVKLVRRKVKMRIKSTERWEKILLLA